MMKWLPSIYVSSLLVITANAVWARELEVRLDIMEFGIYAIDREISVRDAQGISLGTATNVQHTATQRIVPAEIGTTFGFRYRVVGKPEDATVPLKNTIVFPSPGLQMPSSSRVRKAEFEFQARIGETNTELYTLEDDFELIPGTWVLEIWLGNRKLASQPFRLTKQPEQVVEKEKFDRRRHQARKPEVEKADSGCVRDCEGL